MYARALGSCMMLLSLKSRVRRLLKEPSDDGSTLRQLPIAYTVMGKNITNTVWLVCVLSPEVSSKYHTLQIERLQKLQIPNGVRQGL